MFLLGALRNPKHFPIIGGGGGGGGGGRGGRAGGGEGKRGVGKKKNGDLIFIKDFFFSFFSLFFLFKQKPPPEGEGRPKLAPRGPGPAGFGPGGIFYFF